MNPIIFFYKEIDFFQEFIYNKKKILTLYFIGMLQKNKTKQNFWYVKAHLLVNPLVLECCWLQKKIRFVNFIKFYKFFN